MRGTVQPITDPARSADMHATSHRHEGFAYSGDGNRDAWCFMAGLCSTGSRQFAITGAFRGLPGYVYAHRSDGLDALGIANASPCLYRACFLLRSLCEGRLRRWDHS